jgi:hypothetical protein
LRSLRLARNESQSWWLRWLLCIDRRSFLSAVRGLAATASSQLGEAGAMSVNREPFIPPRTRAELVSPAPRGQRHEQMKKIAVPLIGNGLTPQAVFAQLRSMYKEDVTDREINDLIAWVYSKNPQPSGNEYKVRAYNAQPSRAPIKVERVTGDEARVNTENWLNGFRCDECDLWHASPWYPPEDWRKDALSLLAALYDKDDFINVVTDFTIEERNGGSKANPIGAGKTLLRDNWMRSIRDHGAPQSEAGAWIRPNPVKQLGTGRNGAPCDRDVTSHRFCLLESDDLSLELQLSFWARLPLPIAAIIDSGDRSVHAWVRLDCDTAEEYRAMVNRIYTRLAQFGLCLNNKNASRLSRLPGAQRTIGERDDGRQRLLYLNPEPVEAPIFQ